jgi:hypothetical protein
MQAQEELLIIPTYFIFQWRDIDSCGIHRTIAVLAFAFGMQSYTLKKKQLSLESLIRSS